MIYLGFTLSWPFKNSSQKDYIEKSWKVSKNKTLEVQLSRAGNALIGFSVRTSMREDHAGLMFELEFLRHFFIVNLYDNRHWNDEKGRYVNYDDPEEVKEYC